ncbi:sensor histidine kinase [Paramagnetospirillum magnetotacticum]|uniref:sensor histidine kinase n=1 Tax=Paramagnetospirillum magnetotacticum TaxID=188 RepID=UPI000596FF18|nr:response regulator [Paramagnetospirillum magnetotacticum]
MSYFRFFELKMVMRSERPVVLIVDDVAENLQVLGELLQPSYLVKVATSGERALKIASTYPQPDLILLDVMMPVMDGYECLRRLRENPETRKIPVIFVTALDSTEDERKGLDLGAVDYITKPIRPAIVEARVRNHLDMKATRDWLYDQNVVLEAELSRLLEILAHHLQEPVRRQFTFAQLLQRSLPKPLNEAAEMSLAQIMDGAVRLRTMLHDVVLYLAACQAPDPSALCDAENALNIAIRQVDHRLEDAGGKITRAEMPSVWLNSDQLTAIFRALITNAIDYRDPERDLHITIMVNLDGSDVVFSVADNGIGIPCEFRDRVFWLFERLHADFNRPGTGIGLALVKKIVEAARGRVWIEDGDEWGVKICFSLPRRTE